MTRFSSASGVGEAGLANGWTFSITLAGAGRCQSSFPVVRSRAMVWSFPVWSPVRKMRLPTTTGEEWPGGISALQTRLFDSPNAAGGAASADTPCPLGPRNCGQFAWPRHRPTRSSTNPAAMSVSRIGGDSFGISCFSGVFRSPYSTGTCISFLPRSAPLRLRPSSQKGRPHRGRDGTDRDPASGPARHPPTPITHPADPGRRLRDTRRRRLLLGLWEQGVGDVLPGSWSRSSESQGHVKGNRSPTGGRGSKACPWIEKACPWIELIHYPGAGFFSGTCTTPVTTPLSSTSNW
jgi:hypothetical protein